MGLKVSRQACSSSNPCASNPEVSGCINDSNLKSVGVGSNKLQKDAADGFIKMYADMPADIKRSVKLTDSYRPLKVQCNIFDFDHYESTGKRRKKGTSGTPVATPGGSNHGWGRAIDISPSNVQKWIKDNGTKYGWCWGEVKSESWHFTFCGPGPNRDKNCDSFCTGKMTVNTSTKITTVGTTAGTTAGATTTDTTTDGSTTNATTTNSNVSGDTNNSPASLLGGGELMGWLNMFFPGKKSVSENKTKHKINEDINRIKDLMRKNL